MLKLHLVGCIYVIYLWSAVFSFIGLNRGIHIVQRAIRRQVTLSQKCSVTDRIIDISPTSDGSGSILKRLIRHGDVTIGSPLSKDNVAIQWRIFRTDGSLIHDSSTSSDEAKSAVSDNLKVEVSTTERKDKFVVEEEYFEFKIGAVPRQVITGWEHAVKTMYPGELSQFTISPEYAFGDTGALPLIQPNTTLVCELELIKITPALSRKFKSIGYNESIRDELMEQIQSGQSPVAPAVTHTRSNKDKRLDAQNSTHSRAPSTISGTTVGSPVGTAGDTDVNSPTISSVHNAQLREPGRGSDIIKEEGMEAKYFDPEKHKLDAKLQVSGTGKGYSWVENKHSLDIEIPVPASKKDRLKKGDLHIDISVQKLSVTLVDGTVLLQGPLHARVVPSECSWSLLDYPAHKVYKTQALQYVQISLEKGHNYKEVWATVLDREYLSKVDDTRPAHSEEYVRYQEYLQEEEERRRGSDFQRGQSSEEEIIDVSYVDVEVNRLKGD